MTRADIFDYDYVAFVMSYAEIHHIPTGYALFNMLPGGARTELIGKLYNPFADKMDREGLMQWVENHLIFDGNGLVVKVYNGENIIWEK